MIEEILKKHKSNWESPNFPNWKITEIMYCKIDWIIEQVEDIDEGQFVDILIDLQNFIQDLQKLESNEST